jgi:7-keto-8-aminopelargonate synthetase-like enzyme
MSEHLVAGPPMMESAPGPKTVINGVEYLYFAGTSYLGLHADSRVIDAGCDALRRFGVHTATSRSGFGNSSLLLDVERAAATFFATQTSFYFSSGYVANHIAVQSLAAEVDAIYIDAEAHYCVHEAALLTGKPIERFDHRSAASLRSKLKRDVRPLVMADGVVPSNGRIAPVTEYLHVLKEFAPAVLHLDDAHAVGVLGPDDRGTFDQFGLWPHVNGGLPLDGVTLSMCGTLAKAIGGYGGIIPGTLDFVTKARQSSHYYDGASAPASPLAGCALKALEICQSEPRRRERLRENTKHLRASLRSMGLNVSDEPTPNVGVVIRDAATMKRLHSELKLRGILVPYIANYSGTGPEGLMRFAVCSEHTSHMINQLILNLRDLLP